MSISSDGRTISRRPQIGFQAELTPEQVAWFREWDAIVPTLYFMDICAVNIAKTARATSPLDPRKAAWLDELQRLDRPQHSFSYLLALMEKGSDPREHLAEEAWAAQIHNDVASLRAFFKTARVYETDRMLDDYLQNLRGNPIEVDRPRYLSFLKAANDEFELSNPVASRRRLALASKILERADALGVTRQHPTVLVVLARLYGNPHAGKVMNFTPVPERFDAENALADVMLIRRFMEHKLEIEQLASEGKSPYRRAKLITDDEGVLQLARYFEPATVHSHTGDDRHETRLVANVQFLELLTDLAAERRKRSSTLPDGCGDEPDEYDAVCEMILRGTNAGV